MIRTAPLDAAPRTSRRQLLRLGFLSATTLAASEIVATLAPFIRVTRISGLGAMVPIPDSKADLLERFAATNDEPILFTQHKFFLLHAPGGIAAAYRKCTHLGCAVPYSRVEDRFHCPCHQSQYDKHTALLTDGPAPRGLDLFHVTEDAGRLTVSTNPLTVMVRDDNKWHPEHLEIRE